jgi:hypothetical protein
LSTTTLIGALSEGPVDIVGDIHGEIDALHDLLKHLGYSVFGEHPEGRRPKAEVHDLERRVINRSFARSEPSV